MLADIHLENFRSYTDASFEFDKGVNIIVGPNASGKTNLLEAILVLCRGKSYRAKDYELIKFKKPWAKITGIYENETTRVLKLNPSNKSLKTLELNGNQYVRIKPSLKLPVVLFEPNHLSLLSGGPEKRRDFLDDIIEQLDPGYSDTIKKFSRVLAQRNALLKQPKIKDMQLFTWNVRLSQLAGIISRERVNLIDNLNKLASKSYQGIAGSKDIVSIKYNTKQSVENYESNLLSSLDVSLEKDRLLGYTTNGPHRDDFEVYLKGHSSNELASRGENRTILLAFKIAEIDIVQRKYSTPPIILLDDVFSELDGRRRHLLADHLSGYQAMITTTDADIVSKNFVKPYNIITP